MEELQIGPTKLPVRWRRNSKARRYILRVRNSGRSATGATCCLVATIPRGGSQREAWQFIQRSHPWIERQLAKSARTESAITPESEVWFRGQKTSIQEILPETASDDLKTALYEHLQKLAVTELVSRTRDLVALTNSQITRITVRNQRSRWGSCSIRRTISLNWRLIQTPQYVVDYIILHELMHLRQMNHSDRFWGEVESVCPLWREAEKWIKRHSREIMTE
jgi:predicted metal-dependent hydrolase